MKLGAHTGAMHARRRALQAPRSCLCTPERCSSGVLVPNCRHDRSPDLTAMRPQGKASLVVEVVVIELCAGRCRSRAGCPDDFVVPAAAVPACGVRGRGGRSACPCRWSGAPSRRVRAWRYAALEWRGAGRHRRTAREPARAASAASTSTSSRARARAATRSGTPTPRARAASTAPLAANGDVVVRRGAAARAADGAPTGSARGSPAALRELLGTDWDDALEPLRQGGDGASGHLAPSDRLTCTRRSPRAGSRTWPDRVTVAHILERSCAG